MMANYEVLNCSGRATTRAFQRARSRAYAAYQRPGAAADDYDRAIAL